MTELQQTKNAFKFIGTVTRIDKDGAYKEEEMEKGVMEGKTYRKLQFGVKTSDTNDMRVEMFDFEPKEVFLWNSEMTKEDPSYRGKKIPFDEWMEDQDELREEGHAVLQTRIGVTQDEDGKVISQGLPSFVASEVVFDNLFNGDSVVVEGSIRYSSYENKDGKTIEQKQFNIEKLFKLKKEVDFGAENFEEVTYFEQEMVFVEAYQEKEDKAKKKVVVVGRTIDYKGNFYDTEFIVDYSADGDGNGKDDSMVKLAEAFMKTFKFGDKLNVFGNAVNRVILGVADDESSDEEADFLASIGGKSKPAHSFSGKKFVNEMQILGVDAYDKKFYTEKDFVVDDLVEKEEKKKAKKDSKKESEFGGKSKKNDSPFEEDADSDDDGDDDLPF